MSSRDESGRAGEGTAGGGPLEREATSSAAEAAVKDERAATEGQGRFPIVGIGASAGGLEALETLTRRLSLDGMAYVVFQHLAPGHESLLTDILARDTPMPVVTIRDGLKIAPNHIYVAPPNVDVEVKGGSLRVLSPMDSLPRHSIDAFLRSLAADQGARAIGVILSGAGSDGTLGLKAIKDEGGITFAQDPSTAQHPNMPDSAIDAGFADFCLSPTAIGDELMRLSAHPFVAAPQARRLFGEEVLHRFFERIRRAFGVNFAAYKVSTIERRIERRMALQKIDNPDEYLRFLDGNPGELSLLYSDLLIGVTGFFRDRAPFDTLKSLVFPRLLDKRSSEQPIRIWVAGCATGEEAYSLAICLMEYLGDRTRHYKIQIFATDIDDAALSKARIAIYPRSIEADVSKERLQRFFSLQEKGYQVSRQVRDMVVFARHNLGKDPPFSRLDVVSCRNVLIYMQPPLQKKVLRIFHYALNPDAFLILGTSESVGDGSDLFSMLDRTLKIYQKKNVASTAVFDFGFSTRGGPDVSPHAGLPSTADHRPQVSIQQLADRKAIEKYAPAGVLLNEALEVIQFRGSTGTYLSPSPGAASFHILKLVRPELLIEVRSAIHAALAENVAVTSAPVHLWDAPGSSVSIDALPVQDTSARRKCLLVSFHQSPGAAPPGPLKKAQDDRPRDARIEELEHELLTTKEYLQTSVQELESANEELQSSNEELQSSNEELQSTNEELETSKEELQSTNEELATVNDELQNRMGQLHISNDDLQNLLGTINSPIVIVGMDLRIRRFSVAAERLLNLIAGDVGRPVAYLGNVVKAPQIEHLVAETINAVSLREQRVRCTDGHWYSMRIVPYRTADHAIRGAILEFTKSAVPRKVGDPPDIHEFVGKVLSTLPQALALLDNQLRLVWANRTFFESFQVGAEVLGLPLDDVWPGRSDNADLWSALESTVVGGAPFDHLVVERPFGRNGGRPMRFSGHCVPAEAERPALTLLVMEELPDHGVHK